MDDLLQSAMKIKQAEVDSQRPKFRSSPQYLQATLFHDAGLRSKRLLAIDERLTESKALKDEGNVWMKKLPERLTVRPPGVDQLEHEAITKAMRSYEQSYGLFVFINGVREGWKERGIRDEDLEHVDDAIPSAERSAELNAAVVAHIVSVLCNYSLCVARHGMADVALSALREAHRRDDCNVRAAYLLAKHLTSQPTSSSLELDEAIAILASTLEKASKHAADSSHAADAEHFLAGLRSERADQNAASKKRFANLLTASSPAAAKQNQDEAEGYTGATTSASPMKVAPETGASQLKGNWFEQAEQCRTVIMRLKANNELAEAESLDKKLRIASAEKLFVETIRPLHCFDFNHPTDEVGARAALLQIDLQDPVVREELIRLARKHFEVDEPMVHMNILHVEMALFVAGKIKSTELNDQDARNRSNELFETRTVFPGPVTGEALLSGLSPEYVAKREAELRRMLSDLRRSKRR